MTAHSLTGASSMHRWSACPGSINAIKRVPPKASSAYAEEGSDAHALAAWCLKDGLDPNKYVGKELVVDRRTFTVDEDMAEAVKVYVDFINELGGTERWIERKFDLSSVHPGCFGTADAVVWNAKEKLLDVVDYKHGAGIAVEVTENVQIRYYALGALVDLGLPATRVRMSIVQPRCNHPDGPRRMEIIEAFDLLDFRADLKKYAQATEKADAPLVPGDHCRFCPAAATCPAVASRAQEMAKMDFKPVALGEKPSYDPAKLKLALDSRDILRAWLSALDEFAYSEAEAGRTPIGYKLVDKRATRSWRSEGDAIEVLQAAGHKEEAIFEPRELKSPAQMEKSIGKDPVVGKDKDGKEVRLSAYITKQSSGHALVPESDKRPAVKVSAKDDFAVPNLTAPFGVPPVVAAPAAVVATEDLLAIPDFMKRTTGGTQQPSNVDPFA